MPHRRIHFAILRTLRMLCKQEWLFPISDVCLSSELLCKLERERVQASETKNGSKSTLSNHQNASPTLMKRACG